MSKAGVIKTVIYEGKRVQVQDCTPTWQGMLRIMLTIMQDGNAEGKRTTTNEFVKMAKAADNFNEALNENKMFMNVLEDVDAAFATLFIGRDHGITPQAMEACQNAAFNVSLALLIGKGKDVAYTVIGEDGVKVEDIKTDVDVINFLNTTFEYERRDADAEDCEDIFTAIRELRKAGFQVEAQG